ncbi:ROK family transcriptional regulator [Actinopolymorpha pittospori]|uniref:NBD/HSP70 family sugar kinase n=1 Tax=Actinopolymorpha pittospori TaxID=648752 RepID=A0A927N123_9ACTN|nr:ROK family transcriptional regulator [Actinopolymorpha pittospori]MBE1610194.1 putative NBD/HSP70 family sugar kinase [Actinopolymorpha pittospori]
MAQQSANAPLLRRMNARTVFDAIWRGHPISRAEIARHVGMAKPTVSHVLQDLGAAGLVRESPAPDGVVRQRNITFEPVPRSAYVLGIDVGGRFLRAALASLDGETTAREDLTHTDLDAAALPWLALRLRDRLLDQAGVSLDRLEEIVVGMPGIIHPATGKIRKVNPSRIDGYPIVEALSVSLEHPVTVENDINLAALGERWRGLGQGVDDFAFLSVGTGVGAGLVLRGHLYRGHSGAAGEIDLPGDADSPAAHAISAFAHRLYGHTPPSVPEIFATAQDDPTARLVLHEEARRIACAIAPIARVNDVELVVLGGGIGSHCGPLLEEVRAELSSRVQSPPRIEISALGDAPVLIGALALGTETCKAEIVTRRFNDS